MNRIDMPKRVSLGNDFPDGTFVGKLRGMLVYLEGEVGDDLLCVRVYRNEELDGFAYKRKVIADLMLSTEYCKGAYHVDLMRVDHRYQGHGIAPLLYRFLLRKLGIILQAGTAQSGGGRKLWAQLGKMKGVQLFAATRRGKSARVLEVDKEDEELTDESVKLYDGRTVYTFAVAA
jgi:GNAT superfamily N-acetyltransferase